MNKDQTPTPITDALSEELYAQRFDTSYVRMRRHARNLERQLAEANERIVELKQDREIIHQDCERWRKLSIQHATERDNAVSDFKQSEADCLRALHERNEARQQLATERALADRLEAFTEDALADGALCAEAAHAARMHIAAWKEARKETNATAQTPPDSGTKNL